MHAFILLLEIFGGKVDPGTMSHVPITQRKQLQNDILEYRDSIVYSDKYTDDYFEYRHVILPKPLAKYVLTDRLMTDEEWRGIGIQQSLGWEHYMIHAPEPHVIMFRREKNYTEKYLMMRKGKQTINVQ
ncbi:Cyclin-dependent kinase, regulatory subunit domain-containing protein [Rozella allomycis CSF55]|uniref:Cyclin-dependent kinases regulatory subunit n=1 Tax=Rozella allomycis (strain CSF55) TaxID=988480 RepID=A0A075B3F4_ROZAC|nr:Cyclin-dependent kinase, regulatory subunit domain-containing protein [Rozella allomycis CSF55]|eukprot:EPZ35501.1 Cyclin-dependent kinase, regulatory subunit domain-containing protein [Rozella allomycis CSF55]